MRQERRRFLTTSATAMVSLAAGARIQRAAAGPASRSPNERPRLGAIGLRYQGSVITEKALPYGDLVAVCDVDRHVREQARASFGGTAAALEDYRKLLDRKDVDAVLIGTPDHWHTKMTVDACRAGKDVYVEKPLTHSIEEGAAILAARDRQKRVVQVGIQQRSMPQFLEGKRIVASGQLGKIHKVHLQWNRNQPRGLEEVGDPDPKTLDWEAWLGPAPKQPYDGYRFRHWRWFWDFGGGMFTDLMVHFLDVVHWYLDLDRPATALAMGDNFQTKGLWQTPDTAHALLSYPEHELEVHFEGTFLNAFGGAYVLFMGTEGSLYLDRGRYEVTPELKKPGEKSEVLGKGPKGQDFYFQPDGERLHLENWAQGIRGRKQPSAPVEAGISAADGAHLANKALRSGGVARWSG